MLLEIHDHLRTALRIHATRVLICQENGTPCALAVEMAPGHIRHFRIGDPDFNEQLRYHGVDITVITSLVPPEAMPGGSDGLSHYRRPIGR